MLLEKPYFTVYVETNGTYGRIELNRQRIIRESDMPRVIEIPVNQWIKEGENELSMLIVSDDQKNKKYNANTWARMTLRVRPSRTDPSQNMPLAILQFSGDKANAGNGIAGNAPATRLNSAKGCTEDKQHGDIRIAEVTTRDYQKVGDVVSRKITLPKIGLPRWAFLDSDNITNIKSDDIDGDYGNKEKHDPLAQEMLPIYQAIWHALETKNIDSILPLFEERNREYDAAFFLPPGTMARELAQSLKDAMTSPKKKLWPIESDNLLSEIYDNDKIARLRQNNRDPIIGFNWVGGGSEAYDIMLRKKDGKWIITR